MFETIPGLHLTCIDANRAMLEQVHGLLAGSGIDAFETRQSTVKDLELEAGAYDFVSSFNAVHHFDVPVFLRKSRDGLTAGGHLFVYTRLPRQNARSIWGRYFPGFTEKETRLLELGDIYRWIEDTPGLRFVSATCLRYRRRSSLERLVEQARCRHYSTFSLYDRDEFEEALAVFQKEVRRRFADAVEWHDENVLIHALRNDD
jgi:cyclopropane fatty-acyl-phospholipid synthase-like methyltransferase